MNWICGFRPVPKPVTLSDLEWLYCASFHTIWQLWKLTASNLLSGNNEHVYWPRKAYTE